VGGELPVDDSLPDERGEAVGDFGHDGDGPFLTDGPIHEDVLLEVAVAQFEDDVVAVGALIGVEHANDVLGFDTLEDLYLLHE
jgi:hypothetical protein